MSAQGYAAVTTDGEILTDTVSSHERAAMVNWLVVHARFMVPGGMGDFAIRDQFAIRSKMAGASIRQVRIEIIQ